MSRPYHILHRGKVFSTHQKHWEAEEAVLRATDHGRSANARDFEIRKACAGCGEPMRRLDDGAWLCTTHGITATT